MKNMTVAIDIMPDGKPTSNILKWTSVLRLAIFEPLSPMAGSFEDAYYGGGHTWSR